MINKNKLINNSVNSNNKLINNSKSKLVNNSINNSDKLTNNNSNKIKSNNKFISSKLGGKRSNKFSNKKIIINKSNNNQIRLNKAMSMLGMHSKSNKNMSMLGMHLRLNKAMSILGICSRRDADKYISNKSVYVNNKLVENLGTKVNNGDIITVNGISYTFNNKHNTRVWIYNKPSGLVTTHKDEKGRATVFDSISDIIGQRVISVGRLDLNSEGLLLLTNNGEFARYAESPSTGWERHYRVRFFGEVNDNILKKINISKQNNLKVNNISMFSSKKNNNININKTNELANIDNDIQNNELSEEVNNEANKIGDNNNINTLDSQKINKLKNNEIQHDNDEIQNDNNILSENKNNNINKMNNKVSIGNDIQNTGEINNNVNKTTQLNDNSNKTNLDKAIEIISNGINIDGIQYAPIKITNISNNKGLNKWCTCILKEGKNREIRKIFNYFGLQVNKLIRIKYGQYELGNLKTGEIKEVEAQREKYYVC